MIRVCKTCYIACPCIDEVISWSRDTIQSHVTNYIDSLMNVNGEMSGVIFSILFSMVVGGLLILATRTFMVNVSLAALVAFLIPVGLCVLLHLICILLATSRRGVRFVSLCRNICTSCGQAVVFVAVLLIALAFYVGIGVFFNYFVYHVDFWGNGTIGIHAEGTSTGRTQDNIAAQYLCLMGIGMATGIALALLTMLILQIVSVCYDTVKQCCQSCTRAYRHVVAMETTLVVHVQQAAPLPPPLAEICVQYTSSSPI